MNSILRNSLAVLVGAVIGSFANMGIIMISSSVIPPPDGADVTTMEGLLASIHLFEPKHFIMPFLAHALGTFVGAFLAALIGIKNKLLLSMIVGVLFLIGGIMNIMMLPSPLWFTLVDLLGAYIPMAYFGYKLVLKISK